MSDRPRIFLLSPARCSGVRAQTVVRGDFDLASRLRSEAGLPLGELFSFVSGLYFRGKLAYALRFARPPKRTAGVLVITATDGLLPPETPIDRVRFERFAGAEIDLAVESYRRPLADAAARLVARAGPDCEFVLLGSIATGKYIDVLGHAFGERLLFPLEFVGRGDMSRGGLALRCVEEGRELEYVAALGAVRRGKRPPRLARRNLRVARLDQGSGQAGGDG